MTTHATGTTEISETAARAAVPDSTGHFGPYGGRFVPEALVAAIDGLTAAFHETQADPQFRAELSRLLRDYTGRPSPLTDVPKFGAHAGGARVLLKREDLNHNRLAQDQQRARAGAADPTHRQEAG